jgi:hypothetical protein
LTAKTGAKRPDNAGMKKFINQKAGAKLIKPRNAIATPIPESAFEQSPQLYTVFAEVWSLHGNIFI